MNIEALTTRIGDLTRGIEQSAANHNYLLGSLAEAKLLLSKLQADAGEVVDAVNDVGAAAANVVAAVESL